MIITKKEWTNGHSRLCSCMIQLFGDSGKDIHYTCETKPIHSGEQFQQCSHSSSRDCNEHKLCLHWFFFLKPILVSTIWSQTNSNTLKGTANCRLWYCWRLSSLCDYHENNELSGWYSFNPHWWFQRSVCTCVWHDFKAKRYWKLSLCWVCWRTTEIETNFYPSSWKLYWIHCIGWTNVVRCNWQVWCCWKECVKMDNFDLQQFINRIPLLKLWYLGSFSQTKFQLLTMTHLLLSTRNPAKCRVNIGSWLQISDMNCILQTLLDVKGTVFSTTNTTSRWCQHPYSLTQVYAVFIQHIRLFISWSFNRKKLQGFTMLMYSHL